MQGTFICAFSNLVEAILSFLGVGLPPDIPTWGNPAALRELFVLRHVNEFSYEEIADIKGLPVGTVKNRVFQAKELLRQRMGGS